MRDAGRPVGFVPTVLLGLLLQAMLLAYLVQQGFVSVSADEFARSLRSQRWAAAPHPVWWSGVWMPAEPYLNGMSHWLFDDPLLGPRVTVLLLSCVLLVYFAALVRRMSGDGLVTLIAVVTLASHPWYVVLSGTPMLDVYSLAFLVAGLYHLCRWVGAASDRHLVLAGLFFLLASAFDISRRVGMHPDSIATGRFLREVAPPSSAADILLERHYWGYLAVMAASGYRIASCSTAPERSASGRRPRCSPTRLCSSRTSTSTRSRTWWCEARCPRRGGGGSSG